MRTCECVCYTVSCNTFVLFGNHFQVATVINGLHILKFYIFMLKNYSLLLAGLMQRLLIAAVALAILWGVYAWAIEAPHFITSSSQVEVEP